MRSGTLQSVHPVVRARGIVGRSLIIVLALTAAFLLLIALLAIAVVTGPQGGIQGQDQIIRRADTQFIWPWSPQVVNGSLTPDSAFFPQCPPPGPGQPIVAIAIDTSRSMRGEALAAAADAAEQIAQNINLQSFRVGALTFADTVTVVQTPANQIDQLNAAIGNLTEGEDSTIASGIHDAGAMISATGQPVFGTVILISDGIGDIENVAQVSTDLKTQGVRIVTVPVGPLADKDLLQRVASTPSDMVQPGTPEFERLVEEYGIDTGTVIGRDVVLTEQYDHDAFSATVAQPHPSGPIDQHIVWRSYFLSTQSLTYTYSLDANRFGLYALAPAGGLAYIDCSGKATQVPTPEGPLALIVPPWLLWFLLPLLLLLIAWIVLFFWPLGEAAVPKRTLSAPPDPTTPLPPLVPPLEPALIQAPYGRANPTLVIGLGGSGEAVLQHIHRNVWELTPDARLPERLLLLAVDIEQPERDRHLQDYLLQPLPADERLSLSPDVLNTAREFERNRNTYPHLDEWLRIESEIVAESYRASADQAGQRQFGRMVLFEHLKGGLAGAAITDSIVKRLSRLNDLAERNEPIRIFIVSSLAGGFSSGALIDVAHIVRKAAAQVLPGTRNYTLQPILISGSTFQALGTARYLSTNTVATLREIDRLMTMSNRRFPMAYTVDEHRRRPEQMMLDTLLFDLSFLVDATRNDRTFGNRKPHETLYPAIADAIMLMMDDQANVSLTEYYDGVRPNLRQEQQETTRAVINSLGVFSYRVPMRLVAELLEWNVMRAMVEVFFGVRSEGGKLIFCSSPGEEQINDIVVAFFDRGARDYATPEQGPSLKALSALGAVARQARLSQEQLEQDLCLDPANPPEGEDEPRKYVGQFTLYLQQFIHTHLNGTTVGEQRAGRLIETVAILRRIAAVIKQTRSRLSGSAQSTDFVRAVLDGWYKQCEALAAEIDGWGAGIIGSQGITGLHQRISEAEQHIRGQLEALRNIVFRRYLFDEYLPELTARLQRQALEHVERFFWLVEVERDKNWQLRTHLGLVGTADATLSEPRLAPGTTMLTRATDSPDMAVPQALRSVARTLVAPIWQEPIYAWLTRASDGLNQPTTLAEQLLRDTAPLLRFDQLDAPNVVKTRFMSIVRPDNPDHSTYQKAIIDRLRADMIRRGDLQTIDLTSRFNCIFLSTVNVLPIDCVQPYSPNGQYREAYDALETRDQIRIHCLAAEQQAVRYEARIVAELDAERHLLHPRVVALLTNPSAIELLAFSYAHGLLCQRAGQWYFQFSGQPAQQLTSDDLGSTLLDALDQFVLGKPRQNLAHALSFNQGQLKEMQEELVKSATPAIHIEQIDKALEGLRQLYTDRVNHRPASPRERMSTQMHEDLYLLLMLVLHDLRASISVSR